MKTKAGGSGRSTLHGSSPEGTYGPPPPPPKAKALAPEHQAAVTAALNFAQNTFQPPPPPPPPPKAKALAPEHQAAVTAALNFAQNAFQPPPPPPPQPKAPEPKPTPAFFQSALTVAR